MAYQAKQNLSQRTVHMDRGALIKILGKNKSEHVKEYEEAKAAYKDTLLLKLEQVYKTTLSKLPEVYEKTRAKFESLSDDDIAEQSRWLSLFDGVGVEMPVPRCYADAYDMAISIFENDVRQTVELSNAEFCCFVRNEWDWSGEFLATSSFYKAKV